MSNLVSFKNMNISDIDFDSAQWEKKPIFHKKIGCLSLLIFFQSVTHLFHLYFDVMPKICIGFQYWPCSFRWNISSSSDESSRCFRIRHVPANKKAAIFSERDVLRTQHFNGVTFKVRDNRSLHSTSTWRLQIWNQIWLKNCKALFKIIFSCYCHTNAEEVFFDQVLMRSVPQTLTLVFFWFWF